MNVTKTQIMKDLKALRDKALRDKEVEIISLIDKRKEECIYAYKDRIEALVERLKPISKDIKQLMNDMMNDESLHYSSYGSYTMHSALTLGTRETFDHINCNCNWYRGAVEVYKNSLYKEKRKLEEEWSKLIVYAQSLDTRTLKKYIEDNKIELPCMQVKEESTELVILDVNLDMLFGKKSD